MCIHELIQKYGEKQKHPHSCGIVGSIYQIFALALAHAILVTPPCEAWTAASPSNS